jgi:hypothetical protein
MTTRAEILAALESVGLAAVATPTGPVGAGMAWPVWRSTRWANVVPDGVRLGAWWVFVALPAGAPDVTVAEADPLVEAVGMALVGAGLEIDQVEPYRWVTTESQDGVPVLRYSVND